MKLKIYHNPRCRKSREALQHLEKEKFDFEIILYLERLITEKELDDLLQQLDYTPDQLVRKNEALWKNNFKDKLLDEKTLKNILLEHPKLIERPIISNGKLAVVARPLENLIHFLK